MLLLTLVASVLHGSGAILCRRGGSSGGMADPACVAFLLSSIICPPLPLCTHVRYFSLMVPLWGLSQV